MQIGGALLDIAPMKAQELSFQRVQGNQYMGVCV
jgi:hypothetical protein